MVFVFRVSSFSLEWVGEERMIGLLQKKVETMGPPRIEDSMESWISSPFGPPISVRREDLGQNIWD
jgi:hypothetical protein